MVKNLQIEIIKEDMKKSMRSEESLWRSFADQEHITDQQLEQFYRYKDFLLHRNKEINLTSITDLLGILRRHFSDSLALRKFTDLSKQGITVADVGSGAGFPAIPLKIVYPELHIILIEVTKKKLHFLEDLIEHLGLENIDLYDLDWRTFLRKTSCNVDFFISRAALGVPELARAFKPSCSYNEATVVYWASSHWVADKKEQGFVRACHEYKLGSKKRSLIFLQK